MATMKKIQKSVARRVWAWLSRGVNHPDICQPSEWLVEKFSAGGKSASQISDEIWELARTTFKLRFPGLDRPLGSCYHPHVADVLDVAVHYGRDTQRVFRKVAAAAAVVATSQRELWTMVETWDDGAAEYVPPGKYRATPHVELCPGYLGQLAQAVREGRAPEVRDISSSLFEEDWEDVLDGLRRIDAAVRARFAHHIELFAELGVDPKVVSLRDEADVVRNSGGALCGHSTGSESRSRLLHDGEEEVLEEAPVVQAHPNQYHVGCPEGPARVSVQKATFLVVKRTKVWPAGRATEIAEVIATPGADVEALRKHLQS